MGATAFQITSLTIVYSTVYSGADQRKHQSSVLLAFVCGIHRWPVNSRTNGQLRGKCFHLMTSSCQTSIDVILLIRWKISEEAMTDYAFTSNNFYNINVVDFCGEDCIITIIFTVRVVVVKIYSRDIIHYFSILRSHSWCLRSFLL